MICSEPGPFSLGLIYVLSFPGGNAIKNYSGRRKMSALTAGQIVFVSTDVRHRRESPVSAITLTVSGWAYKGSLCGTIVFLVPGLVWFPRYKYR